MELARAYWICALLLAAGAVGCSDQSQTGSQTVPQPPLRTAAAIHQDFEKERLAGNPYATLAYALELIRTHSGTAEADKVAKLVPELEAAVKAADEAEQVRAAKAELANKWVYSETQDPMTSRTARYAIIDSENTVDFAFPYQGPQHGKLQLRDHPTHGRDVIFLIERGQLLCPSYEECKVRIRFDDAAPERWNAVGPSDHSTTVIFLRDEARFIKRLRAAKVIRIQVPVFQQGEPVFEFQVGGFDYARYQGGK